MPTQIFEYLGTLIVQLLNDLSTEKPCLSYQCPYDSKACLYCSLIHPCAQPEGQPAAVLNHSRKLVRPKWPPLFKLTKLLYFTMTIFIHNPIY